ncbi:hypothetical protein STCU_10558 [Strigomonas culicis]|uniref:Uncharacterized protein n=1 Tax=Strigomonas culicis TaxID=28005 RepID=S9TMG2_9TRYP|nr:hypothetical protein STCU_10558 [Strigomonas culicis]|eukprot:EPY17523.1 hypothetical protein STCU_10558 [Strigomonas culicis]
MAFAPQSLADVAVEENPLSEEDASFNISASSTDSVLDRTCRCGKRLEEDERCSAPILQAAMLRTDHELRHQNHRHQHNANHVVVDPATYPTALPDSHQTMTLVREAYHLKVIEAAVSATANHTNSILSSSDASTCTCSTDCPACVDGEYRHRGARLTKTASGDVMGPLLTYSILQHQIAEYHNQRSPANKYLDAAEERRVYGSGTATYYPRGDFYHCDGDSDREEEVSVLIGSAEAPHHYSSEREPIFAC